MSYVKRAISEDAIKGTAIPWWERVLVLWEDDVAEAWEHFVSLRDYRLLDEWNDGRESLELYANGWVLGEHPDGCTLGVVVQEVEMPASRVFDVLSEPDAPPSLHFLGTSDRQTLAEHIASRLGGGAIGELAPVKEIACKCGAGPDRLSSWHANPPGWTCKYCGGFVPRAGVTGDVGPHPSKKEKL